MSGNGNKKLDLASADEVRAAAAAMERRLRSHLPAAQLAGYTVQEMVRRPGARETIAGAAVDPIFGPVVLFGHGGVAVEVVRDRAVGLPPLNMALARELVSRTRVSRLLDGYRDRPPADRQALYQALTRVSQVIVDLAEVVELDVNPLLVDEHGVIALDARVRVAAARAGAIDRLAIRPYPRELERRVPMLGEEMVIRPIRPEDETLHARFLARVEPGDLQLRFFHAVREFSHAALARFTQIDYDREMALIAWSPRDGGETLGVARAIADPDRAQAEFAVLVRSDLKRRGLGKVLMRQLIEYCRESGVGELWGEIMTANRAMLDLARGLGFELVPGSAPGIVRARMPLASGSERAERPARR